MQLLTFGSGDARLHDPCRFAASAGGTQILQHLRTYRHCLILGLGRALTVAVREAGKLPRGVRDRGGG